MKVDFFSFDYVPVELKEIWRQNFSKVINSGKFIGGDFVTNFEEKFSSLLGVKYGIGVSNGYDGLEVALRALGISKGDFVAVPAHTFIATWNAILSVGAVPVGIDIDSEGQMCLNRFQEATQRVRIACVIPVHMHGHLLDLSQLAKLCQEANIKIIEDCSQSHLAQRDGIFAGTISDTAVFSLYPTKNLGALGDAGIVITNNETLAKKVRSLINYGSDPQNKYLHHELGYNKRLDPLQATILETNLGYLASWNRTRNSFAEMYIRVCELLDVDFIKGRIGSVWHHFCIKVNDRDRLREFLFNRGVSTEIHYPKLAAREVENFNSSEKRSYPNGDELVRQTLSLPLSQFHSIEMIDFVCEQLKRAKSAGIL